MLAKNHQKVKYDISDLEDKKYATQNSTNRRKKILGEKT